MKIRTLKSLGFRAGFNEKGKALLTMPAVELPAEAAEAFTNADLARGLREGAKRLEAAADKISKTGTAASSG